MFKVELVGEKRDIKLNNGLYTVHADKLISEIEKTDLIIIPDMFGDLPAALDSNKKLIPWIVRQYESGAEVASLCVGVFCLHLQVY